MNNNDERNTTQKTWSIPVIDAGDGSGDGFITFPDELLASTGWIEGDTLSLEIVGDVIKLSKVQSS